MSNALTESEEVMAALHTAVAQELYQRVTNGEASAAELSVAVKFLKDNHVDMMPKADSDIAALFEAIPDFDG